VGGERGGLGGADKSAPPIPSRVYQGGVIALRMEPQVCTPCTLPSQRVHLGPPFTPPRGRLLLTMGGMMMGGAGMFQVGGLVGGARMGMLQCRAPVDTQRSIRPLVEVVVLVCPPPRTLKTKVGTGILRRQAVEGGSLTDSQKQHLGHGLVPMHMHVLTRCWTVGGGR
jgi:hypothetical protein